MDAFNLFNHPVYWFSSTVSGGQQCIDCIKNGQVFNNAGLVTDIDPNVNMRALEFALRLSF